MVETNESMFESNYDRIETTVHTGKTINIAGSLNRTMIGLKRLYHTN